MMSRTISNVLRKFDLTISKRSSFSGRKYNYCLRSSRIRIPTLLSTGAAISCRSRGGRSTPARRAIFKWKRASPTSKPISVAGNSPSSRKMSLCSSLLWSRPLHTSNSQKSHTGILNHPISYSSQNNPSILKSAMWGLEPLSAFATTPRRWPSLELPTTSLPSFSRPTAKKCILSTTKPTKAILIHLGCFFCSFVPSRDLRKDWKTNLRRSRIK